MKLILQLLGAGKLLVRIAGMNAIVERHVTGGMERVGLGLERHVKTQKLSGQSLGVRTGNLRRAVYHFVRKEPDGIAGGIGVDLKKARYGRLQELGGTIRPKKSRFLTIPLDAAQTGKGVARFSARDVIANPGSFGYTGTFFRNRILFGVRGSGKNKEVVPLFALKTHVTIKGVGYLAGTVNEKRKWAADELKKSVDAAIKEIKRG